MVAEFTKATILRIVTDNVDNIDRVCYTRNTDIVYNVDTVGKFTVKKMFTDNVENIDRINYPGKC